MSIVYMDNNATTKVAPEVIAEMQPLLSEYYGNPSSMYTFADHAAKKIKVARNQVADALGATPDEIIFTSCGTESNSTAIHAAIQSNPTKRHIITTRVEHPAVKNVGEYLAKNGYRVSFVPVDNKGNLDLGFLYERLTEDTAIVSVMWANNESGVIFPIEEIAQKVTERGIVFHTDAVQAVGKIPVNMSEIPVDMLSLSGHKLHAPKGIGVLYVRKGTKFSPFLRGGHQEHGRRGGTENTASIVGLGKACELAVANLKTENTHVRALRD